MARLDNPNKQWKFSAADVAERAHWDEYMQAYEDTITATSTEWAPWYVIPADNKQVMQAMVATILVDTIALDLSWPTVSAEEHAANAGTPVKPCPMTETTAECCARHGRRRRNQSCSYWSGPARCSRRCSRSSFRSSRYRC